MTTINDLVKLGIEAGRAVERGDIDCNDKIATFEVALINVLPAFVALAVTTKCPNKNDKGYCPLPNVHCGYPQCEQR